MPDFAVDSRAMLVPAEWTGVLDVELDGRRVVSVEPSRYAVGKDGRRRVPWPGALRPYLTGSTQLRLRLHAGGAALVDDEVAFDDEPGRVAVVDAAGNPLAADKLGRLSQTFESLGSAFVDTLLDEVQALITDVHEILGVPAFLAYGGLLGAVREGRFIGHDNDVDISYLSAFEHPADIARESFRLRRGLRERGWTFHVSTATFLQVLRDGAPPERRIDIFTAYYLDGIFALDCWVRGPLERSDLLPLGEVVLAGRTLPAPARPEPLLALTYGPGWAVPDPSFTFVVPASTTDRAYGWFGGPFAREAIAVPPVAERAPGPGDALEPTDYARWVADRLDPTGAPASIVALRWGLGPDSTWWAERGHRVLALDVKYNSRDHAGDRPELADRLRFDRLQVDDLRRVLAAACLLTDVPTVLSLDGPWAKLRPVGWDNLWLLAAFVLRCGGAVMARVEAEREADVLDRLRATGTVIGRDDTPSGVRLHLRGPLG